VRAGIYCRISKDRTGERLGVDRQEEDCRDLCARLGWEVVEVFVDNDISATSGKVRPAYKRLLASVADGTIDAIACWHPDRLYRRTVDLEELVAVCDKARAPVATVNAGAVDLTTPTGRLVAGLLAQVAKYEGEHKAERWRRSYLQRRKAGVPSPSGPRLYGYTRTGEQIPEEAARIRSWTQRILQGDTLHMLMRECERDGILTTRGNIWTANSIRNLLGNPRLAGWVTIKGEPVVRSDWEPILTDEESESVRAILAVRRGRTVYPRVAVLRGVARCAVCGAPLMTGRDSKRGTRQYRCPPVRGYGQGCVTITAEPLEEIVEAYAQERLADPRVREEFVRTRIDGSGAKIAQEIAALETRLVALEAELVDGSEEVGAIARAIDTVKMRIAQGYQALGAIGPTHVPMDGLPLPWPEGVERRNALVRLVVGAAWVERATPTLPGERPAFNRDRVRIEPK
jgi:site-specific DNA recombinase